MFTFGIKQRIVALASAILTVTSTLVFLPVSTPAQAASITSCSAGLGNSTSAYVTVTTTTTSCTIKFLQNNTWSVPEGLTSIAAAVVGGGGGGGFGNLAGGGGGGEVMFSPSTSVTPGATTSIVIGAGGSQGFINSSIWVGGGRGGTSSLGAIYAGGGFGGTGSTNVSTSPSSSYGGSGGGLNQGGGTAMAAVRQSLGGWTSYANAGGVGSSGNGGGGGGGAGAVGNNASGGVAGSGGNGITLPSPLSSFTLAGGGGGWNSTTGAGGTGGGGTGNASTTVLAASAYGTANTGGGGGAGGPGGTGVVIVQFALPTLSFATTSLNFGSPLTLSTTGGAGAGAVSYTLNSAGTAGCSISAGVLSYTSPGTCTATATKAADATFASTTTGVTTFTINSLGTLTPSLGSPSFSAGVWTIPVTNYDANFTWSYSASSGGSVSAGTPSGSSVTLTVTPVAGSTSAVTVTTTRTGYTSGTATSTAYYRGCASTSVTTGSYTAVSFTATGTCNYIAPVATKYDYLVLAGGGAGGQRAGGGGGAGGYLTSVGTPASRLDLTTSQVLQITVGAGGSGGSASNSYKGANGDDSVLVAGSTLTAKGGGGGATGYGVNTAPFDGFSGGSGGGAVGAGAVGSATGTPSTQGNSGGLGSQGGAMYNWTGGGGGGAGSAGVAGSTSGIAGNGGSGLSNAITGTATCYAAGGGGGAYLGYTAGTGGACSGTVVGGAGSVGDSISATSAAANTGSGGGGAGFYSTTSARGNGGSGIVVLRYITSANTPTLGSLTVSGSGFTVPVTNYDANFTYSCNISCTQSGGTITVSSIPAGTTSFTVTATGPTGAAFAGTSTAINAPGAPTGLSAKSGNGKASISFTAGATGGSAITNYKYSTDGVTYTALATPATSSPITIPGLTNGTSYTIYLKAVNALGDSVASSSVQVVAGTLFDLQGGNYSSSTGVWTDVSANNDTPTLLKTTTPAAGATPNSVTFTGSSGAAQFVSGQSLASVGAFTQSVWFKTNSSGKLVGFENADGTSATGGNSYDRHLYVGTDGYLYFGVYSGQTYVIKSTTLVNDSTWRFATATFDGTNMKLYVNGSLVASGTGGSTAYTGYFRVGGYKNNFWTSAVDGYFTGSISRVAVYLYAQSAAQVTAAYGSGQTAQTVTFTQPTTRTVTSGSFTVAPSASSGLTVTLASNSTSVCTVSGLTVSLVSSGTCSLTATQAGDPFNASASATQTFTVSPVTVTFDANGGTGTTAALSVTSASGNSLTANAFSKTGYSFSGWNTAANGTGTAYAAGATIAVAADTTLYAQWTSALILDFDATDRNSWTGGTTLTNRNSNYPNATLSAGTTGVAVTNSGQTMNFAGGNPVSSAQSSSLGPYGALNGSISTSLFQAGMTVDIYGSLGGNNNWERFIDFGKNKGSAADASYNLMVGRFSNSTSVGIGLFNQSNGTASPGWCNTATWALDSNPHRFTFVLNGSTCAIYVDGIQQNVRLENGVASSTISYGLPTNNITWDMNYIGRSNWSADTSLEGSIRSLRLFGTALAPSAIDTIDSARLVNKTVAFSSSVSTTAMPSSLLTTGTIALPSTSAASRTGYTLSGWYTDSALTTLAGNPGANFTPSTSGTTTLYASWSRAPQTVTYALDGGAGTLPTQASVASAGTFTVASGSGLTKSGYTFAGWSDGTNIYQAGSTYTVGDVDVVLTAQWSAGTYTLTYNYNGATGGNGSATATYTTGGTAITLPTPTKTAYVFAGWYSDALLTNSVTGTQTPSADATLYAKWNNGTYTLTYNYNGATGGNGNATSSYTTNGTAITLPSPTKPGYVFGGWYADSALTSALTGTQTISVDTTIYAKWNNGTYTLTYNYNGATSGAGVVSDSYTTNGTAITLPTPSKTGYVFAGWFADSGLNTSVTGTQTPTVSATLYAKWTAGTYVITYTYNGATGGNSSATSSYTTGGTAITLPTPTRTGYTFSGWFAEAELTTSVSGTQTPSADGTLYAKWTAVNYTLTYNANNATSGSVPTDAANYNIGNSPSVAGNTSSLARTGYTFAGWTLASNGSGTVYNSGDALVFAAANQILYAKWAANTYTISYNVNGATGTQANANDSYTTGGTAVTLSAVGTMAKTGHTFAGWSTSANGNAISGTFTTTANTTLYAVWSVNVITVTYSKGSASTASFISFPANTSGNYGTRFVISNAVDSSVTFNGSTYAFVGWSDGTSMYQTGEQYLLGANNVTLTAIWVQAFGVRYIFNGGTPANGTSAIDAECLVVGNLCTDQQRVTANPASTRPGFTFTGWTDQSGTPIAASSTFTVNINSYLLYAGWQPISYTVTYLPAGGATTPTQASLNYADTFTLANAITRTGYSFAGWSDGTNVYGAGASYTVGLSPISLTAQWTPDTYVISYDWNGGTGSSVPNVNYTVGNAGVTLASVGDHIKDGYQFGGWSLTRGGDSVTTPFIATGNTVLYAIWGAGSYSITLDQNYGMQVNSVVTVANGNSTTLPTPTRNNFVFDGWYSAASGGTKIANGGASYTPSGSRQLYAQWIQASLYGVIGNLSRISAITASDLVDSTYSGTSGGNGVSVNVPRGALPAGTIINLDLITDNTYAQSLLTGTNNYLLSLAVSWLATDGTVPDTANSSPVSVTITNSAIRAGALIYSVQNGTATLLGTAVANGTLTVQLTQDPSIYVVQTVANAPISVTTTVTANSATVTWQAPISDGGAAITGYSVTLNTGATCTTTLLTCTFNNLITSTNYTATVTAINSVGNSAVATAAFTPVAPVTPPSSGPIVMPPVVIPPDVTPEKPPVPSKPVVVQVPVVTAVAEVLKNNVPVLNGERIVKPVQFAPYSAKLDASDLATLKVAVSELQGKQGTLFVTGFVKFEGKVTAAVRKLALTRAKNVALVLAKLGIKVKIGYLGYGPLNTKTPKPTDRRVELRWVESPSVKS